MARRVKVTHIPPGYGRGLNTNEPPISFSFKSFPGSEPELSVKKTLEPTTWDNANVEAEKGEVVVTNFMKDGIPELYKVGGKSHNDGGTPLNLPNNSFVFSKDKNLKFNDPNIVQMFGKNKSGKATKSYTPADLAKQYDLNEYRKVLANPDSSRLERETAELMIQNYVNKLGALAMVQESMKGFPDGVPGLAMGYLGNTGINPEELFGGSGAQDQSNQFMQQGGEFTPHMMFDPNTGQGFMANTESEHLYMSDMGFEHKGYGGSTGKRKVKVSFPEKKQQGGTTGGQPETGAPTKVQNIPEGAVKWDETAAGYDETQIQPGDYVKKSDGKWYQVSGYKASPYTYEFSDNRLVGEAGDLQEAYGRLEQMLLDPNNDQFREDWLAGYKKELQNTKPNKRTGLSQEDIDLALNMSDDEIIQNFLNMEKQIMGVNASGIGGKGMDPEDSWDKDRSNYVNTVTQLGFEPLDIPHQAGFQAAYITLNNMSKDGKYKDQLQDFRLAQEGRDDENVSGLRTGSISQVDGWVGNTTIGQAALYKPVEKELQIDEVDWQDVPKPLETPTLDAEPVQEVDAPWWLQDIVKTAGAAGDFTRIKKHMPWQAVPGVHLPNPTFYDPTRELAANAEQAAIASQAAGVFGGPQAINARTSAIQGQAAQNVADIMGRYNTQNVQTANQFEMMKSQILNQASLNQANLATQLYDKNVIANQAFDNAKNMARQEMRQSYIDAITNRAQAQVLNELYPQYNIDPMTGGMLTFAGGRDLVPSNPNTTGLMDKFQEYKSMNPGVADDVLFKMASADMGVSSNTPTGVDPSFLQTYGSMMG